jgi:phosphatidylinositol glycan class K
MLQFMEGVNKTSKATMADLVRPIHSLIALPPVDSPTRFQFATYNFEAFNSNAGVRSDLFKRPLEQALVTDFFGGVTHVEVGEPVGLGEETLPVVTDDSMPIPINHEADDATNPDTSIIAPSAEIGPNHTDEGLGRTIRSYLAVGLILGLFGFSSWRK